MSEDSSTGPAALAAVGYEIQAAKVVPILTRQIDGIARDLTDHADKTAAAATDLVRTSDGARKLAENASERIRLGREYQQRRAAILGDRRLTELGQRDAIAALDAEIAANEQQLDTALAHVETAMQPLGADSDFAEGAASHYARAAFELSARQEHLPHRVIEDTLARLAVARGAKTPAEQLAANLLLRDVDLPFLERRELSPPKAWRPFSAVAGNLARAVRAHLDNTLDRPATRAARETVAHLRGQVESIRQVQRTGPFDPTYLRAIAPDVAS
jgi:hypothetical protein